MTKKEILSRLEIIRAMTENEGVKQLCDVMEDILSLDESKELGFKA